MRERRVTDQPIIERIAVLETKADDMRDDVRDIKRNVQQLTDMANKGRGSLATILWAGGFATAAVGVVATVAGFFWGNR
jgi:hypothetical protein